MRKPFTKSFGAGVALSLLALAGCDQIDPLKRPYMWQESGANAQNIAAMAANPADLTHGRSAARHRVRPELEAVENLWAGKPKPLLTSGSTGSTGAPATSGGGS